jgi:hypothetical protein
MGKGEHSMADVRDERLMAMEKLLGTSENMQFHSVLPLYLGGDADVVEFCKYVPGHCYVTSDLAEDGSQLKNSLGNYELMICTRGKEDWAPNLIARLARYTFEAVLEPRQTMDVGPALPQGSGASALLFVEPDLRENRFVVAGSRCGFLLCVTIMPDELKKCRHGKTAHVLTSLKEKGVFPFSELDRKSVL